jgi:hypothetical protein
MDWMPAWAAPHAGGSGVGVTPEWLSGYSVRADRVRVGASTDFIQFLVCKITDTLMLGGFHKFTSFG